MFKAETRWTITPTLAGIFGYWYELVDFNGDEAITPGSPFNSDIRNSHSHFIVGGADYTVSPHCFISARGGAQNVTYENLPDEPDEWNPFADVSATFEYAEGSYFRVGARYGRNRTDVIRVNPFLPFEDQLDQLTLDEETAVGYGVVNHRIFEHFIARASGQLQWGEFNRGSFDGENECIYLFGASLVYELGQYLRLEGGYYHSHLDY